MINFQLQTKMEDEEVNVADMLDILDGTTDREIIVMIQQMRHIIRFLEDGLYQDFLESRVKKEDE